MKTTKTTKGATGAQRGTASAEKSNKTTTKAQVSRQPEKKQGTTKTSMVASTRKK